MPILNLFAPDAARYSKPLLSIKTSEFDQAHLPALRHVVDSLRSDQSLRLFLHAYTDTDLERHLVERADLVYCGNLDLYQRLYKYGGHKVVQAWCPGTLLDSTPIREAGLSVLTFGMAHKMRAEHFHKLDDLLRATGESYCLYVSTALHEGTTLEEDFLDVFEQMKQLFSGDVYFLGFLSDTAVYNYLRDTTYFAAFFPGGVRANNTSVNTAMGLGATVITNLDELSPPQFRHMESVIDINSCDRLPTDARETARLGANARRAAQELGWAPLIRLMRDREMALVSPEPLTDR